MRKVLKGQAWKWTHHFYSYSIGHNSVMWSPWTTRKMRKICLQAQEEENKSILKTSNSLHHSVLFWPSNFQFTFFQHIEHTYILPKKHNTKSHPVTAPNSKSRMSESILSVQSGYISLWSSDLQATWNI